MDASPGFIRSLGRSKNLYILYKAKLTFFAIPDILKAK